MAHKQLSGKIPDPFWWDYECIIAVHFLNFTKAQIYVLLKAKSI